MRTYEKPINFNIRVIYEKICAYPGCIIKIFFTDNIKAKCCCDQHRYMYFQFKNKDQIEQNREFIRNFKLNCIAVAYLYSKGYITPTMKELELAGFILGVSKGEIKTKEGSLFIYGDYSLIIKDNETLEIRKNNKNN